MRCPSCGSRLVELERSEVMVDACPECRGVWLDRGELDRVLERERRVSAGVRDEDDDFFEEMEGRGGGERERPAKRGGRDTLERFAERAERALEDREHRRGHDDDDHDHDHNRGDHGRRRRKKSSLLDLLDF